MNKLFLGLFVCTALCACSNDELGVIPDDTPNVFAGSEAYINVRLADAGSLTRAQEGDFEYGTNEKKEKNALIAERALKALENTLLEMAK